jgi:hypothetical protein
VINDAFAAAATLVAGGIGAGTMFKRSLGDAFHIFKSSGSKEGVRERREEP